MRRKLARVWTCASLVAAAIALMPVAPTAQQQPGAATPESMQRAQESYQADQMRAAIARSKEAVVQQLMNRWRDEIGDTEKGLVGFETAFMAADPEKLLHLTQAKTWDAVIATQYGMNPEATLGSTSADLVFTPVTPCRVMDSRLAAGAWLGPFNSGQTVSLYVTDPLTVNGHTQGGAASCAIPFGVGNAVALNITVVPAGSPGDLKIFPFGGVSPNSSIINFVSGLNLANAASAGIALANSTNDLSITVEFATNVHIIVDVLGYYSSPQATALQTTRVNSAAQIVGNGLAFGFESPTCPTGYALTGGGYLESVGNSGLFISENTPVGATPATWRVAGRNATGASISITVYGVCGRVPGR